MYRVPFPWEEDQTPRKVPADLEPVPEADGGRAAFPGAQEAAARVAGDPDPHRSRRGAQGAADALYEESQARGWGLDYAACRDRVNIARSKAAAKRR